MFTNAQKMQYKDKDSNYYCYELNLFIQCTQKKFHQVSHGMGKGPGMEVSTFAREISTESGGFQSQMYLKFIFLIGLLLLETYSKIVMIMCNGLASENPSNFIYS